VSVMSRMCDGTADEVLERQLPLLRDTTDRIGRDLAASPADWLGI